MAAAGHRPVVDVNAGTVLQVARLLREAEEPVSRNWLMTQMGAAGRGTTRQRLNRALAALIELGVVIDGSKGVQWVFNDSPRFRAAKALAREATIDPRPRAPRRR